MQNQNRSMESLPRDDAMLLPAGIWRRVFRILWGILALNSLWTFGWTLYYTHDFAYDPPPRVAEGLQALGWSLDHYFWFNAAFLVITFVSFFTVGLAIFLLRSTERMALFASIFLMAFGTSSAYITAPEYLVIWEIASPLYVIPFTLENLLAWPLLFTFFALYPDGRFVPRWMIFFAAYGFVFALLWGIFPIQFGDPQGAMGLVVIVSVMVVFISSLYAQVQRYRHYSSPVQRQQTKWLIYGLVLIVLSTVGQQLSLLISPIASTDAALSVTLNLVATVTSLSFILLPVSIGIAILRYRLWDIDVLIRRTLTYALLSAFLVLIYFGSIVALQRLFSLITGGEHNEIVTVVSTLGIAALFIPLRNKIQQIIDQRFYRKKYDAQKVLNTFAETVRDETDLNQLSARLIEVVQETMQPKSVSIWLNDGGQKDA